MATETSLKIAEGHQRINPYLIVPGAAKLIEFLTTVFNGKEALRVPREGAENVIMHGEVRIGASTVMMADATPEFHPFPASLYIYVEDVEDTYQKALNAGGISLREPRVEDYGVKMAGVQDPFGNQWWMAEGL